MNINEHYVVIDGADTFHIELPDSVLDLLPALADMIQEAALTKRSFTETAKTLRFSWLDEETKARIQAFMQQVTIAELAKRTELVRQRQENREKFLALTDSEFGDLLDSAAQGKLCKILVDRSTLRFSASELMPVTHFKKLARLGHWNAKAEQFEYSLPMNAPVKDKLFDAVLALSRSTKKVTKKDIAERRELRIARERDEQSVFNIEEMDFDDYAGNFGTHAALVRQADGGFKKFERAREGAREDTF
ncbi:hypothetical protein GTP46_11140 [Duganella sp. FT135W]|uniref:Uncharacterized protein n=1 Tax=Duganella flavida TaxID=2692175 RepID=A0A6L8K7M6_9BURK|nr:hypothetical protein [Duganella flavida]MYM23200.1 hypothetical protein [Duganella flavida]